MLKKNLNQKRDEFMTAMAVPVPEALKFNDKLDEPIGGNNMAELISRTLAQRNFEMDQIHKTMNKEDVANFLKPAETSIKNDTSSQKQPQLQLQKPQQYQYQPQPIKYIKIGENVDENVIIKNNVIDLNSSPQHEQKGTLKKVLSWNTQDDEIIPQLLQRSPSATAYGDPSPTVAFGFGSLQTPPESDNFSNNIFAKLKPLSKPLEPLQNTRELDELKIEMKNMNNKIDFITEQLSRFLQHSQEHKQEQENK